MQEREEIAADAALYALGQLDPQSSARFEARLREGCGIAQSEYAAFVEIAAAALGASVPLYSPPPGLRDRVLARIVAEPLSSSPAPDASHSPMVIVRADGGAGWLPGPAPGIEVRLLHKKKTLLVRLAPGATVPRHYHDFSEQCLVLSGSLTDGEITVNAGDFVFMPAGSTHPDLTSETGCTFLIAYT